MSISPKPVLDAVVNIVAAVAAPVTALLIDSGAVSGQVGADIAAVTASLVIAYHGGTITERRAAARRPVVAGVLHTPFADPAAASASSPRAHVAQHGQPGDLGVKPDAILTETGPN